MQVVLASRLSNNDEQRKKKFIFCCSFVPISENVKNRLVMNGWFYLNYHYLIHAQLKIFSEVEKGLVSWLGKRVEGHRVVVSQKPPYMVEKKYNTKP
jgi:hypothetical protein